MSPSIQTCLNTFKINSHFFVSGVATLDADVARKRIGDEVNPIIWIAGHLLTSRKYLLQLFGVDRELPFESKFTEKYDPSAEYPPMTELEAAWKDISGTLFEKMSEASEDHFTKEIDWNLPNEDKTIRGAILFYLYHEGWHLGQIAYARRAMGMEGLVPY